MTNHNPSRSTTHHSCRPHLEVLEDRAQPALVTLNSVANLVSQAPIAVLAHHAHDVIDTVAGQDTDTHAGQGSGKSSRIVIKQEGDSDSHDRGGSDATPTAQVTPLLILPAQVSDQVFSVTDNLSSQTAPAAIAPVAAVALSSKTAPAVSARVAAVALSTPNHPDSGFAGESNGDGNGNSAISSGSTMAGAWAWAVRLGDGLVAESQQYSAPQRGTPTGESNAFATSPNGSSGGTAESHPLSSGLSEASEDTEVIDRLVLLTDVNAPAPDDGSLAVDAASSLMTGGRRRAVVLPQDRSDVASVATLLDDGSASLLSSSEPTSRQVTPLLLNPLSAARSITTAETMAISPAEQSTTEATTELENESSVGVRLGTLVVLPLLGGTALLASRLRKRDEETR